MAKHDVKMKLQTGLLIQKGDVIFEVKKGGRRFGSLKVSQGGAEWRSKNNTYGYKLNWTEVDEIIKREGKSTRR